MSEVLALNKEKITGLLSMAEVLEVVEHAFKLQAEKKTIMPSKIYIDLPENNGDYRAMPAYIDGSIGIKWVSVYPNNRDHGLQTVIATITLCDPETGCPTAIMDGTHITDMRTGAAGGIAAKYLAKKDSTVIGMIGAGMQAQTQLLALSQVFPSITEVKVFDQNHMTSRQYAEYMGATLMTEIHAVKSIEEALEADIVVTATPSTKPLVRKEYIRPGTHINAIGADAKGKQELDANLLKAAKIVVDDIEQSSHSGEINVPLSQGLISIEDIYCNLSDVVAGIKRGRSNDQEITVFDSTGLAIHDIICAKLAYNKAKEEGIKRTVPLMS